MTTSQIMVFTQRPEFKALMEIECRGFAGIIPIIQQGVDEVKNMLALLGTLDVLIVDEPEDKNVLFALIEEIQTKKKDIKEVLYLGKSKVAFDEVKTFSRQDVASLIIELKKLLAPRSDQSEGHISIPIDSLVHFKVLPFDLFVKISDGKFIKRIPAHESIDDETFANFMHKGVSELYFEKRYNRDFSLLLINSMINEVEQDYVKLDEKLEAANNVFQTTHQIVSKLGFKPKIVEVCESVMSQIYEDVSGSKDNFAKFLLQLREQKELGFNYRLMELTSFSATQMLHELEASPSTDKIRRLIFTSMFCDYSLKSPAHVHTRTTEQLVKLPASEQKTINEHALKSSELAMTYPNAPLEAVAIIKQHHGSLTGLGFPLDIPPKLLPMAKLFMVAQEVSYQILMQSHRPPIDVLSDLKSKYNGTVLEEYFVAFVKSCRPT